MVLWWNSMTLLQQIFASIAIASTIILILQTILLLFSVGGSGGDFDHDAGFDHGDLSHDFSDGHDTGSLEHDHDIGSHDNDYDAGLRIFTVRGFVTFFCIFGWSGLVFLKSGVSAPLASGIATVLGLIFMVLVALVLALFLKLQSNGNVDISAAVGISGTVYIPIPPSRSGSGKITANVAGRFSEYDAVTDCEEKIPTGAPVTVLSITGGNTLVVIKK